MVAETPPTAESIASEIVALDPDDTDAEKMVIGVVRGWFRTKRQLGSWGTATVALTFKAGIPTVAKFTDEVIKKLQSD